MPLPARRDADGPPSADAAHGLTLDVCGAARLLGVSDRLIRGRLSRGLLPCRRYSGRIIFLRDELEAFIEALPGTTVNEARKNLSIRTGDKGYR